MPLISIENGCVQGVDVHARTRSLKQMCCGRGFKRDFSIPILNDINFFCKEGERIGFIGNNGSGKSSLLKVISSIYPLQSGKIIVEGVVAPVIEMGLGFEPELSGRLNIKIALVYNNMLSMYSKELEEEVINFSGIRDSKDLPIKVYSSGMLARLAFSIAMLPDPDILLLDEVFAVGDSDFVQKAKSSIENKFHKVPIAILVSHQEDLIRRLCNRCLFLENKRIVADGTPEEVLRFYHSKR